MIIIVIIIVNIVYVVQFNTKGILLFLQPFGGKPVILASTYKLFKLMLYIYMYFMLSVFNGEQLDRVIFQFSLYILKE